MSLSSQTILILLSATVALSGQTNSSPTAEEVAAALQKKYDTIRDFTADFVHRYEGGALRRSREERGTLFVKKPGKMRWDYKSPNEKQFVSNGTRLHQYFPADNRVVVSPAPEQDQPAVLFLSGRGNLTRDFNLTLLNDPGGAWKLRLEPKKPQQEYDWLEITADRETFRIQALTVGERTGSRSTFTFSNFKENTGLADKLFEFSIPRGAEVTYAGPVKR